MSQSDDFLSRWSRRKQQAAREAARIKEDDKTASATHEKVAEEAPALRPATTELPASEPVFDLSKLPSLDSIGPNTDLSAFMRPGVPASLSRAALRRGWSADPGIRDFIGLSENSWDFTKPETIAGFGQLLPIDDVKKMLARVLSDEKPEAPVDDDVQQTALQQLDAAPDTSDSTSQLIDGDQISEAPSVVHRELEDIGVRRTKNDLAARQDEPSDAGHEMMSKRRHGGALPT